MNIDSDRIIAQEIAWINQNEPTFLGKKNTFTGKVGRTMSGESIQLEIKLPQFYPVIRPELRILNNIDHPNIESGGYLNLQIVEEWDPQFRLKDVLLNVRRLLIRSKRSITDRRPVIKTETSHIVMEIQNLQREITAYNKQITDLKSEQLNRAGVSGVSIDSLKISRKMDYQCQLHALDDLLELLEIKFEEAELDQTDFFRLYRRYVREKYVYQQEIVKVEEKLHELPKEKTKRSLAN